MFTRRELLELAARASDRRVWLAPIPRSMVRLGALCMTPLHPRLAQFGAFAAEVSAVDCLAPRCGTRRLEDYLRQLAQPLAQRPRP